MVCTEKYIYETSKIANTVVAGITYEFNPFKSLVQGCCLDAKEKEVEWKGMCPKGMFTTKPHNLTLFDSRLDINFQTFVGHW